MYLESIEIREILPCLADPEKIRFIAYFEKDISEVFPYLNSILEGAIYNHEGKTLTLKKEGRLITLHADKIAAGKVLDEEDAKKIVEWLKERINYSYENRASIKPIYERRHKLSSLDIYKLLPGTNCRKCGELTCLAFAVKLSEESVNIMSCKEIFSGEFTAKRNELLRLLKSSGYSVPEVFILNENK